MGRVKYRMSDDFIQWAESLSAMMTKVRTDYGGISSMLENSEWDESRTEYALQLIVKLSNNLSEMKEEMDGHIRGRPQ